FSLVLLDSSVSSSSATNATMAAMAVRAPRYHHVDSLLPSPAAPPLTLLSPEYFAHRADDFTLRPALCASIASYRRPSTASALDESSSGRGAAGAAVSIGPTIRLGGPLSHLLV